MDSEEFAMILMDESRREWQNPRQIIEQIGVKRGACVADLACGPGYFTVVFSEAVGADGIVYAIDIDSIMINNLQKNLEKFAASTKDNVRIIRSGIQSTGIPDNSVDILYFANILHDIDDKRLFFSEAKRIAKSKSSLFVDIDWHKREMESGPPFHKRLSEAETRKIFNNNGFKIIHLLNAGPHHYGIVARINLNKQPDMDSRPR
ncbi:MAG: class I SAM-dependent methyltransferase [Nitrososphaerales archaeon]